MQYNKVANKNGDDRMNNIVIGVEGLVGSGKTSLCRELLK